MLFDESTLIYTQILYTQIRDYTKPGSRDKQYIFASLKVMLSKTSYHSGQVL